MKLLGVSETYEITIELSNEEKRHIQNALTRQLELMPDSQAKENVHEFYRLLLTVRRFQPVTDDSETFKIGDLSPADAAFHLPRDGD